MTLPSIYFNYASDSACPYHRLLCPARFCGPDLKRVGYELLCGAGLPEGHDAYVMHGLPNDAGLLEIGKLKRRGAKFAWSVDDDWLTIPDWNPAKPGPEGLASYEISLALADFVITSTPALKETFSGRTRVPVFCCPNLMDLTRFPEFPYVTEGGRRRYDLSIELPVKVVWVGGHTHKEDIAVIEEPLIEFMSKYDASKVVVVFQGMAPPPRLLTKFLHRGLFHQPSVPFPAYQKILNSIRPDVYLAPMAPVEFNRSKSNIRITEGWSLMAAPVATPWGEYECIQSGIDGRYAGTAGEWVSTIGRLATDHEYRLQLATAGRERVEREYDWNNPKCRRPWNEAFAAILGVPVLE